jgi:hypothetical protein
MTARKTPAKAPTIVKKFIVLDDDFDRIRFGNDVFDTLADAKKSVSDYVDGDDCPSTIYITEVVMTVESKVTPTFSEGYKK